MSPAGKVIYALSLGCFMLGSASPILPLPLVWRSAILTALALIAKELLVGPIGDPSISDVVADAIEILFMLAVAVGLAIRLAIAAALKNLTLASLGLGPAACRYRYRYRWVDRLILAFVGSLIGFCMTKGMASILGGHAGGYRLDIGIGFTMALAAAAVAIWRPKRVWIPVGTAFAASASIAFYGAGQTQRILESADAFAAGPPWCLTIPANRSESPGLGDIGFFSLRKDNDGAHLIAMIRDGESLIRIDWSIRQQRFNKSRRTAYEACSPRIDQVRALVEGT